MKISEITKKNKFHQVTFYKWLRDRKMIEKVNTGYVVGSRPIEGMKTVKSSHFKKEIGDYTTVVSIDNEHVSALEEMYVNSGYKKIYSTAAFDKTNVKEKKKVSTKPLNLKQSEKEILIDVLRREMENILKSHWQGTFGISNCQDEEEVWRELIYLSESPEVSDGHQSEASRALGDIEPYYEILNKIKRIL